MPDAFHRHACRHYQNLGSPPVSIQTVWQVYSLLLAAFKEADTAADETFGDMMRQGVAEDNGEEFELLEGYKEFRYGKDAMGELMSIPATNSGTVASTSSGGYTSVAEV